LARISVQRAPAAPTAHSQVARRARILNSAAELGAIHGYDGVQMQEVARDAGVAVGTVYRYFPSKTQLFLAVMAEEGFGGRTRTGDGDGEAPVSDIADLLVGWTRRFTQRPKLALAMVQSTLAAYSGRSAEARAMDVLVAPEILGLLGIEEPVEEELSKVRLLTYAWWGVVISRLSEHMTQAQAEEHIRLGAALFVTPARKPA